MDNFVLIIGAAKSGTTSLFRYLAEHPEISACSVKEPNFFTKDEILPNGWIWYKNLWKWDPKIHKISMEASTSYTKIPYFPDAAERIAKMPANFKFIYLLRNPLERIESHYSHGQIAEWNTTKFEWNRERVSEDLINVSSYAKQISGYYARFPSNHIKLVLFEDLIENKSNILRSICEFLGVASAFQFQKIGRSYNQSRDRIANPLLRKLSRSKAFRQMNSLLPYMVKRSVKSVVIRQGRTSYKLSSEARKETLEKLKPDLKRLRDDYGVDIQRWGLDI